MGKKLEIVGGPNGCGKTTLSEYLIESGRLSNMINADVIAKGLDASNIKGGEITAGKIMLNQLNDCLHTGKDVSFETTLSGRTWINLIRKAKKLGYEVVIYYIIVENPEQAVERINERVARGGHHIPSETVVRRYHRSVDMLFAVYGQLADSVFIFDNSNGSANLIATKNESGTFDILKPEVFKLIFNGRSL